MDEARLPTRAGLTAAAERAGIRPAAFATVHQAVARTLDEYVHNASLRADSDLQAISDEQFARGMDNLRPGPERRIRPRPSSRTWTCSRSRWTDRHLHPVRMPVMPDRITIVDGDITR